MIGKIPKITGLVCVAMMVVTVSVRYSFCSTQPGRAVLEDDVAVNDLRLGYRPVPEVSQCIRSEWGLPDQKSITGMHDNHHYRKWCEETFVNGNDIYNAYKKIAFDIKYTPEREKIDFWQTPSETARIKRGDCEDAVFLFFSLIPPRQKCAEIVWGWVIDRKNMVAKAHVWYQLKDKKGIEYVVEGFSQDWSGIIPMEVVEIKEIRKPIFIIPHSAVGKLACSLQNESCLQKVKSETDLVPDTNSLNPESVTQPLPEEMVTQFSSPDNNIYASYMNLQSRSLITLILQGFFSDTRNRELNIKEISNILTKLHEVFFRYASQKKAIGPDVKVVTHQRESGHFSLEKNFLCRR